MMKRIRTLLYFIMQASCSDSGEKQQQQEPTLFQKPFAGDYPNSWPFDHQYPAGAFSENCALIAEDHALTWRGELLELTWNTRCHNAHDWSMPIGTPLLAMTDGQVMFAGEDEPVSCGSLGDVRALVILIRHILFKDEIYEPFYVHLDRIDVEVGAQVEAGQQIGLSGNTGCSSNPHLHLGVYRLTSTNNGLRTAVDPFGWSGDGDDPWEVHPDGARSLYLWDDGEAPRGDYGR